MGLDIILGWPGHQPYITLLAATLRFIDLGQAKNGWLFWSG